MKPITSKKTFKNFDAFEKYYFSNIIENKKKSSSKEYGAKLSSDILKKLKESISK